MAIHRPFYLGFTLVASAQVPDRGLRERVVDRNGVAPLGATITVSNLILRWLAVIAALPLTVRAEQRSA